MIALFSLIGYLTSVSNETVRTIYVLDETGFLSESFKSTEQTIYTKVSEVDLETAKTLGANPWQAFATLLFEVRFALLAAVVAAFGRIIAEVGSAMMVGGNILHHTRNITTAIALETGKGEFVQGVALGIVLLVLALVLNVSLGWMQSRSRVLRHGT